MLLTLTYIWGILYFLTCLHFFQWKNYYKKRYIKYLAKKKLIKILNLLNFVQICFFIIKNPYKIDNFNFYLFLNILLFIFNIFILLLFLFKSKKIKFKFTYRIFRLVLMFFLVSILLIFTSEMIVYSYFVLSPILMVVFDLIDWYKYYQNNKFLTLAKHKLNENKNLITIGITGSNGKTTIKEILSQILSTKFNVFTTAKNQNTPKGAVIAINKNLNENSQIFICEMGAKSKGDIAEICALVRPQYGIISSVCGQHLETFKTEQNVYLTKKELSDYLKDNYCVYNIDNDFVNKMYLSKPGKKAGISIKNKANLFASNIHINNYKTYFDINYNNQIYPCHTCLLGEHNVINILLALQLALELGVDLNSAIQIIINLKPMPHRLEYIKSHIDIIDDSYNCSLDSAKCALNVLKQIPKRKIICTPGIIEGGGQQFSLNSQLSIMMSNIADVVIIVGKTNQSALISELDDFKIINIVENKLSFSSRETLNKKLEDISPAEKKCAYLVSTLKLAKKLFTILLDSNDVLLLLNDLPDDYD